MLTIISTTDNTNDPRYPSASLHGKVVTVTTFEQWEELCQMEGSREGAFDPDTKLGYVNFATVAQAQVARRLV